MKNLSLLCRKGRLGRKVFNNLTCSVTCHFNCLAHAHAGTNRIFFCPKKRVQAVTLMKRKWNNKGCSHLLLFACGLLLREYHKLTLFRIQWCEIQPVQCKSGLFFAHFSGNLRNRCCRKFEFWKIGPSFEKNWFLCFWFEFLKICK